MAAASSPSSSRRSAYSTRMRSPTQTVALSTTRTGAPHARAASSALSCVPDRRDESVTASGSSPASSAARNACSNACGVSWLVVGSASLSTSFS